VPRADVALSGADGHAYVDGHAYAHPHAYAHAHALAHADSDVYSALPTFPRSSGSQGFGSHAQSIDAQSFAAQRIFETDAELIPGGNLWIYLDLMAQHDGHLKDFVDIHGSYLFTPVS
jgi:hypothetical protein